MPAVAAALAQRLLSPFRDLPAGVHIQIVATLINTMGGIAKLFLPLYFLERYRLPYGSIGLLMGCYGLGCFIGAYAGGALSDRLDTRKLCAALLLAGGLLTISLALPLPVWGFVPLLLLTGLADGGFRPGNMRLVLEPCAPSQRATAQGLYRVAFNLGVSLAGITGGLLAVYGYQWVFVAQGCASLLACLWLVMAYRRQPQAPGQPQAPAANLEAQDGSPWRDAAFLRFIAGQLLILAVFDQMYGTLGMFLREHYRLGPQWIGYLFTLNGLMVVLLQVPIAQRIQRWGLARSSHLGVLGIGLSFCLLNAGTGAPWALLAMLVLTVGELLLSPTWSVIVMQCSEGRQRGRYLGIYSAAWSGRTLYAPALGTWIYGTLGGAALWWLCAGVALLTVALQAGALRQMLTRP
ncbi:MFS transporter [Vogesella sp. LYT5W]|uniref:MFS transporter n=1 Tax=Vogesella margarita TaxID=2984199 RepID=A0ABT5IPR4_9NEIS|nr:MFS transporter [Vogesella margarita]MDC7714566.1 MFS transporter [Vogesella margarita]